MMTLRTMTTQTTTDLENTKDFWHTEQQILWTVQSERTSCCGRSDRVVQRKSSLLAIYSKETKRFCIKIYKLCNSLGYTYDMSVYLGKQRQHAAAQITAMHRTVLQVIWSVQGLGHKIFKNNYFTSPALFDDLFQRKINGCGTVRHERHGMPWDIGPKYLKMKRGS